MAGHHSSYYGYFTPGVYDYPVTHSAASTRSAYNWEPILASSYSSNWCNVPVENSVTYVAAPLGGVINYVTDVESHLALPTSHTLATNQIYTTLPQIQETTSYPLQSLPVQNFRQMHEGNHVFEVQPNGFRLALPSLDEVESESESDRTIRNSTVITEITEGSGSKAMQAKVIPKRKKRTQKRVYKAKQGYLVEEPSSELSDEEGTGAAP
ncbi:uncharacterized protein [Drosophila kikkawai]|uniref:Uncharacterized protein n=1 Tax=Drosophila kikkawai TaxID=30033 RepID=A0A6P4HXF9_DROKI|nr:uncharacterized protein LOC108073337 [Drosophila kikkawai]KAH8342038.1 hypothetical protein KR059_009796 [Drosophila kikkawai]